MLMINALVSWNVMVNVLPSLSLSLSPRPPPGGAGALFLSVSLPTWALWWESTCRVSRTSSVSFFSSDWRGSSGWLASCSPSWSSSCAARVSVHAHAHTHARILYTHTHTHTHTLLHWVDPTKQCGPALIAKPVNRIHMVAWASAIIAPKKMSLWLVFSAQYETCYRILTYQINWAFTEFQATHGKCLGVRCLRWKLW